MADTASAVVANVTDTLQSGLAAAQAGASDAVSNINTTLAKMLRQYMGTFQVRWTLVLVSGGAHPLLAGLGGDPRDVLWLKEVMHAVAQSACPHLYVHAGALPVHPTMYFNRMADACSISGKPMHTCMCIAAHLHAYAGLAWTPTFF
jgi:hypothetical protein